MIWVKPVEKTSLIDDNMKQKQRESKQKTISDEQKEFLYWLRLELQEQM